jgi:single-strand DNA-binding protein
MPSPVLIESPADVLHVNEVRLRGFLAAVDLRVLPSGDELLTFRLTVDRAPMPTRRVKAVLADVPARRVPSVDSIQCVTSSAVARRVIQRSAVGDLVEVTGSVQRRFWKSPSGPASLHQVEVATARRIKAAGKARSR